MSFETQTLPSGSRLYSGKVIQLSYTQAKRLFFLCHPLSIEDVKSIHDKVILDSSKDGVAVYEETHDYQLYGQLALSAISKDPLIIIQGGKKNQYLYFSKIHHLAQEKDVGSACHFNIIALTSAYHFKVDVSVDYICWMHVLTTQSYLTDAMENNLSSSNESLEKIVFENRALLPDRSNGVGLRQESISWDLRRNSTSSLRNNLKSDSRANYMSPPVSLSSSAGGEETKSETKSHVSPSIAALKRWSVDEPIRPFDKPSEWQTKAIS